jgi:hypothetical protein
MENNSLEQIHKEIILLLLEQGFIKSENQESDLCELYKCGTKYRKYVCKINQMKLLAVSMLIQLAEQKCI